MERPKVRPVADLLDGSLAAYAASGFGAAHSHFEEKKMIPVTHMTRFTAAGSLSRHVRRTTHLATMASLVLIPMSSIAGGVDDDDAFKFSELAPAESAIVLGMDNAAAMRTALQATTLCDLWQSDQIQTFLARPFDVFREGMNEDFGLDWGLQDLPLPSGPAGIAMYEMENPDAEEGDAVELGAIVVLDFGDEIDRMLEWFDASLEGLEDEDYDVETFEDRTIYVMDLYEEFDEEGEAADFGEEFEDEPEFDEEMWEDEFSTDPPFILPFEEGTMYITFDDSIMLISSDMRTMEDTILLLDGHDAPTLADNATFNASLAAAGEGGEMYFSVLVDKFLNTDALADVLALDASMLEPLEAIGLTDLDAISGWMSVGREPGTLLDSRTALYMEDGMSGLWSLATTSDGGFDIPAWVDPDVDSAVLMHLDFGKIVPLVRSMIESMPPDVAQQASDAFEATAAELLTVMFAELGPEVSVYSWAPSEQELKDGATGGPSLFAISCSDELTVENGIAPWAGMLGMTPRDFLGYRIYDLTDPTGTMSMAIGFGKGHVLIGMNDPVEQALRATEDTPGLIGEPEFMNAADRLPAGAMAYTYSSMRARVEMMLMAAKLPFDEAYQQAMLDELRVLFEDAGMDFDEDLFRSEPPDWYTPDTLPTTDFIMQHVGDSIMHAEINDQGIVLVARWLSPNPK